MRSTFYLRVFRKHLGMYLCGFGAEWLFASIFTYFVIFVLQHDPAMVAGLNSLNSILQLISTALFIGLCVKRASANPIFWRWGSSFSRFCCIPRCGFSIYRPAWRQC
nr:hypothetical protein [Klebsiella pneumoniae subsp. pneumoniae]